MKNHQGRRINLHKVRSNPSSRREILYLEGPNGYKLVEVPYNDKRNYTCRWLGIDFDDCGKARNHHLRFNVR